ncbi:FMN-linked oxidoreductase [Trichoderma austrokoningii]
MDKSNLFKPLKIGNVVIKHRIGMAPMTRLRATDDRVPLPLMAEYYGQRSGVPGTLLISEGTLISYESSGGFANAPGIWNENQIAGWRSITDRVHGNGSFIFCQIFAMGRAADEELSKKDGVEIVGPSPIPMAETAPVPRAMTLEEIKKTVQDFATAAQNAILAGFDGVEVHGANGYLIDQFIQDNSNQRHDNYGANVENRSRFIDEIMNATVAAIGPERVGLRLSPWSSFQGMKMTNPIPQFSDIISKASRLNLAYLHLVESRISGSNDCEGSETLEFAYNLWDRPLLIAGGYKLEDARQLVNKHPSKDIVVMYGRYFIANPDLVYRVKEGLQFDDYKRESFYTVKDASGYIDYPFRTQYLQIQSADTVSS